MIYANAPEFDALIQQLQDMNIRFATLGHFNDINGVIVQGCRQIENEKDNWDYHSTIVHYIGDLQLPTGPGNITISFEVEFVKVADEMNFHRIRIH